MKKSTKVSLILVGVGAIIFTTGLFMSGREIANIIKSGDFGIHISNAFRHNGLSKYKDIIDEKYDKDTENIKVDIKNTDIYFTESDDDYIHVAYGSNYKNIFDVSESGQYLDIKGIDNHGETDSNDWEDEDDYDEIPEVSIGSDGITVDSDEANVNIDSNGVKVESDEADVNIGKNGIDIKNIVKDMEKELEKCLSTGKMVVYIPKDYKGNIVCDVKGGDVLMSGIIANKITANVENGDIELEKLDALKGVEFDTKRGDIVGTMKGDIRDYNMRVMLMGTGNTDLPSEYPSDGPDLFLTTDEGDIEVDFFK